MASALNGRRHFVVDLSIGFVKIHSGIQYKSSGEDFRPWHYSPLTKSLALSLWRFFTDLQWWPVMATNRSPWEPQGIGTPSIKHLVPFFLCCGTFTQQIHSVHVYPNERRWVKSSLLLIYIRRTGPLHRCSEGAADRIYICHSGKSLHLWCLYTYRVNGGGG